MLRWAIGRGLRLLSLPPDPGLLSPKFDVVGMMGKFDIKSPNFDLMDLLRTVGAHGKISFNATNYPRYMAHYLHGRAYLGITYAVVGPTLHTYSI